MSFHDYIPKVTSFDNYTEREQWCLTDQHFIQMGQEGIEDLLKKFNTFLPTMTTITTHF